MMYLMQLDEYGIILHSSTEEYLTTDNELVSNILLSIMSYFAKLEREKISERIKAGLEKARFNGERIGRSKPNRKIRLTFCHTSPGNNTYFQ
jgi:DNA invertase Pin-like site-specific DNA recombinase